MKTNKATVLAIVTLAAAVLGTAGPGVAANKPVETWDQIEFPELPEFQIPKPEQAGLDNGITVLMLPNSDLPLVRGRVLVNVGSRLEPDGKVGLAAITGAALRSGGTANRSADEVDDFLAASAPQSRPTSARIGAGSDFSCLSQDLDTVLSLVAEMLRQPAFAEDRIDIARTQEKTGISRRNDNITQIAGRRVPEAGVRRRLGVRAAHRVRDRRRGQPR